MPKLYKHTGIVVPLDESHVDTDVIIPKQFLKKVTRTGFGKHLFHDWRFLDQAGQQPNPNFILNKPCYRNASILLTKENFGCGSSREHAIWALKDYGFYVIIAESFADIFYCNSVNNQLLSITLSKIDIDALFTLVEKRQCMTLTVDITNRTVLAANECYSFKVDNILRDCIINGLDPIGCTMVHEEAISKYERHQPIFLR